jgi:hypothetical protein
MPQLWQIRLLQDRPINAATARVARQSRLPFEWYNDNPNAILLFY